MQELEAVVLNRSYPEYELGEGDVGAIVHVYNGGMAFEFEFVTADGKAQALLTLAREDVRPMTSKEILHVRELREDAA